jgi:hypothetical protein
MTGKGDWVDACLALSKAIVECRGQLEHLREIEAAVRSGSDMECGPMSIEVPPWRATLPDEFAPGFAQLVREVMDGLEARLLQLENDLLQVKAGASNWYLDAEERVVYDEGVEEPCNMIT